MAGTKDFDTKDGGTAILDIPPIDSIDIQTGGNEFDNWRKKFKNYATYLTMKKLGG
jgi:hypothetical protein